MRAQLGFDDIQGSVSPSFELPHNGLGVGVGGEREKEKENEKERWRPLECKTTTGE